MIYIYDTVIDEYDTTLKRYGKVYKLENRTRMGDQMFYTFTAPNMEKLLIIPRFAQQYREAESFYQKIKDYKKLDTCLVHIKSKLTKLVTVEDIPDSDSETGYTSVVSADYKDIRVQFEFKNSQLLFSEDYEILCNNIFGNGLVITMNLNMEDAV